MNLLKSRVVRFAAVAALAAAPVVAVVGHAPDASAFTYQKIDWEWTAGVGPLVGAAFDSATNQVVVYPDFSDQILRYSTSGVQGAGIALTGTPTDRLDLDFTTREVVINGTTVPRNVLLTFNGAENKVRAVNGVDGTALATRSIPSRVVGGTHHSVRNTFFVLRDGTGATPDTVAEINPNTGATINEFPVRPSGSPLFPIVDGDIAAGPGDGLLYIISGSQANIRVLQPNGTYVTDTPVELVGAKGLAIDINTGAAWVTADDSRVGRMLGGVAGCNGRAGTIIGNSLANTLNGTNQNDIIIGLAGDDTINGYGGNDTICAGRGNDTVHGNANSDKIFGGADKDTLYGDDGVDNLDGGPGSPDACNGGPGSPDTAANCEIVTGFP